MSRKRNPATGKKSSARSQSNDASGEALVIGPGLVIGLFGIAMIAGLATLYFFNAKGRPDLDVSPDLSSQADATGGAEPAASVVVPSIGRPEAPISIVEFSDYQCPNCRQFAVEVMPWLKENWIEQGVVRVEFRDFAIRGPASTVAAEAAHCAGDQGAYWSYHDALYEVAGGTAARKLEEATFLDLAESLGLDSEAFGSCLASGRHRQRVDESSAFASAQGFEGTPTYLINGRKTQGAINIADWDQLFRLYQQDFATATESAP